MTTGPIDEATGAAQEAIRLLSSEITRFSTARISAEQAAKRLDAVQGALDRTANALGGLRGAIEKAFEDLRSASDAAGAQTRASVDSLGGELRGAVTSTVEEIEGRSNAVLESLERLQVSGLLNELSAVEMRIQEALKKLELESALTRESVNDVLAARSVEIVKAIREESRKVLAGSSALRKDIDAKIEHSARRQTRAALALSTLVAVAIVVSFLAWLA